ncbi:hypothetical protein PCANC_22532 [Puccinia coronata f. sp. avenae]|uniref:Uncharacterized protein n=1 Tax=Puccinia coronata f. sp. avenae TaxID=200324 RepID=A0A2N5TWK6_9BASI|nr:hypothetical protein PCANC_22532 [Puccinia coronata f. sp. avenae]
MVFWNHFNEIHYTPDSEDLLKFLHRGMAAQCASSKQSSFDHLFTIYLKPENSDRLDEEHVTFCGISVKDQITEADLKIRNHEWTDTHSGIQISNKNPYLVLLMSLTTKAPSDHLQRLPKPAGQRRASQVFHGLNEFPCLTRNMVNALTELLKNFSSVTSIPMEVAIRKHSLSGVPDEHTQLATQLALDHFKDLHPMLDDPEASFRSFLDDAGLELVTQYLNDLKQFVKDFPAHVNRRAVIPTWDFFVQGHITLEKMTKTLHIQDNAALRETALDLAFLRNYPHHFLTKAFTRHKKMQAIRCNSKWDGKRLLSKLISKFDQEAKYSNMLLHILRKGLLVGPAMSGKTQALHKLSNHTCVVYICLRPPTSSGHPPRSALAPTMLPPGMTTSALEKHYNKFLTATFQVVADFFCTQNETISNEKTKLKNWVAYNFSNDLKFEESNQFSRNVLKKMETCSPLKYGQENEQLQKALANMQSQAGFVLLAIDEAHALLSSPNTYLEHATSFLPSFCWSLRETLSNGIFTILTGASSLMLFNTTPDPYKSNPQIAWYPDAQLPLWLSGHKLLDPIYQLGTFDSMVSATTQPGTWTDLVSTDQLVSYRSPFFAACFRDAIACHQERNLIL